MSIKVKLLLIALVVFYNNLSGQQKLSLIKAQEYAVKNANSVTQSLYDEQLAKLQADQLLAVGLPQLNGSVQFQNFLDLPTSVIPAGIFGPTETKVRFGVPYQMTAGVSGSQLLFDGSWLVGLQASREYAKLTSTQVKKSAFNIKHEVAQAYHLAVIAKESIALLSNGKTLIEQSLGETKALYKEGFLEEQNVDQLQLNDWNARIVVAEANAKLTMDLLKFKMGMPIQTEIELEDNSENLSASANEALLSAPLSIEGNFDVQLANQALGLQTLNLKNKKAAALPNLAAFYNLQTQALRQEFNFADTKKQWYPIQLWGVQMNIPILSGGRRYKSIQYAQLEVEKSKSIATLAREGALLSFNSAKTNYLSAMATTNNSRASLALAEKIFNKTNQKYKEGLVSSFELTQANNQVLQAQGNYVQSLLQLLNTKDELQKALNQ
jgi:outer membrane protein TolC